MKSFSCILLAAAMAGATVHADDKWDISQLDLGKLPPAADKPDVTFAKDIRPLFEASCLRCHGENRPKGDLRLDSVESALAGGKDGKVVIPGDSQKSLLVAAAAQVNNEVAMPPKRGPGGHGGPGGRPEGNRPPGGGPGDGPGGFPAPGGGPPEGQGGGNGGGRFGPPPKALTAAQVGLVRAWIDQGAK